LKACAFGSPSPGGGCIGGPGCAPCVYECACALLLLLPCEPGAGVGMWGEKGEEGVGSVKAEAKEETKGATEEGPEEEMGRDPGTAGEKS
jgi:hypothetical protein